MAKEKEHERTMGPDKKHDLSITKNSERERDTERDSLRERDLGLRRTKPVLQVLALEVTKLP